MNKLRSAILAALAVLVVAMMLAPIASAQAVNPKVQIVKVGVQSTPIKPQIENPSFTVEFNYILDNPATTVGSAVNSAVTVDLTFQCQNGVVVTGPAQVIVPIQAGATSTFPGRGSYQINIPRTAPGLQAIPCLLKARAQQVNAGMPASPEAQSPFTVTADYYSVNQVKLASKLKQSGPQKQVPFEMEVTNFGNARTQYIFEIGAEPSKGKWNAILPEVLLLDSPNSGQGSPTNTAVFTVATPFKNGWNNEEGAYQIVIKPASADDPSKTGNPLSANMLVRVRGVYVPSIEPFVMLGAILGSALLLRLRKDE